MSYFEDYREKAPNYITLTTGEYYPDILPRACEFYKPVLVYFGQIVQESATPTILFEKINEVKDSWFRIQLCRIFRKYVSPSLPVEMLKKKSEASKIAEQYEHEFRDIATVQEKFHQRPLPDEALCALLWEYKDRGKKRICLNRSILYGV